MSAVRCLAAGVAIALLITLIDISPVVAEKFPVLDNRAGIIKSQCQPMIVLATIPNGDNIGLDVYEMNDRAKSHFSAAELLAPRSSFGDNAFIIETTVIGEGYFALMKFRRVVDLGGESYVFAIVWEDVVYGIHGGRPHFVMDVLSDHYERFIDIYLDVNDASCASKHES